MKQLPGCRPHHFFHFPGKMVVFRVQDTLFKLDATLFTHGEDSAFKTMLNLPQGGGPQEGTDDVHPIVLQGDTAPEFESLVWGLFTHKFSEPNVSSKDIPRFIQVAEMSHKYDIKILEAWATSGLYNLIQNNDSVRRSTAARLLPTFVLCDCTDAITLIRSTIRTMLVEKACSPAEIITFIDLGQRYGFRDLIGRAYCEMLLKPRNDWKQESTFTRVHHIRLLAGHYMLTENPLLADIQSIAASLEKSPGMPDGWPPVWTTFATESKEEEIRKAKNLLVVDVAGRFRHLFEQFLSVYLGAAENNTQRLIFQAILEKHIDELMETKIADYFLDAPDVV